MRQQHRTGKTGRSNRKTMIAYNRADSWRISRVVVLPFLEEGLCYSKIYENNKVNSIKRISVNKYKIVSVN